MSVCALNFEREYPKHDLLRLRLFLFTEKIVKSEPVLLKIKFCFDFNHFNSEIRSLTTLKFVHGTINSLRGVGMKFLAQLFPGRTEIYFLLKHFQPKFCLATP